MEKEELILAFFKGRDNRVIARTDKGKVCLLDFNYCKEQRIYVNDGEVWRCAVKFEKEKYITVQPITRMMTVDENVQEKTKQLAGKYSGDQKRKPGKAG